MNFRNVFMFLSLISLINFTSCADGSAAEQEAEEMVAETENALANVSAEIREESNELAAEMSRAKDNLDQRLEAIEAEMEGASAEAKAELQEEYDELKNASNDLEARMKRVGNDMEAGWKDFKGDFARSWNNFTSETRSLLEDIEADLEGEID